MHQQLTADNRRWSLITSSRREEDKKENQKRRNESKLWKPNWKTSKSRKKSQRKAITHPRVKTHQSLRVKVLQRVKVHWRAISKARGRHNQGISLNDPETSFQRLKMLKWWFKMHQVITLNPLEDKNKLTFNAINRYWWMLLIREPNQSKVLLRRLYLIWNRLRGTNQDRRDKQLEPNLNCRSQRLEANLLKRDSKKRSQSRKANLQRRN